MDKLLQALAQLLPTGFAWPRHADSTLMRWLRGLAGVHAELLAFIQATIAQWMPHSTTLRLSEWEDACALPDACFGPDQTIARRHAALMSKLQGLSLPYDDSSPAAPIVIQRICASLGYTAEVFYNTPFRVGVNDVGDQQGALDGTLYVMVSTVISPFRVGVNRVGDRLFTAPDDLFVLLCHLRRIMPARFDVVVLPKN